MEHRVYFRLIEEELKKLDKGFVESKTKLVDESFTQLQSLLSKLEFMFKEQ